MCGIAYQPCMRDSFRIGPNRSQNVTNNTVPAMNAANSGNASAVNLNVAAANSSFADVVEGSGAGSPEQEMVLEQETSSTNSMPFLSRLCRDRILIPCDFEEFITVRRV